VGILSWIVFGLIAGALARWIMPGKQAGGWVVSIILGVVGAIVGGWIGTLLGFGKVSGFDLRSLLVAVGGAVVVLLIYRAITRKG
jgi:uncharacterized membrane protein YeaQ/YmgE (transglycosylase-associated protein family)